MALIGLFAFVRLIRFRNGQIGGFFERGIAYATVITLVYITETVISGSTFQNWLNVLLVIAAIAAAVHTRYHLEGSFKFTPLDFLVVLVAILLHLLHVPEVAGIKLDVSLTKLLVLFYVTELILNRLSDKQIVMQQKA